MRTKNSPVSFFILVILVVASTFFILNTLKDEEDSTAVDAGTETASIDSEAEEPETRPAEVVEAVAVHSGVSSAGTSSEEPVQEMQEESHDHSAGAAVEENRVDATCEENGSFDEVIYCTVCGAELSRETETTEALGHDWDEGKVTATPTCEKDGVVTYICKNDESHIRTETASALGHDMQTTVIRPSCTVKGSTVHVCSRCNYSYEDEVTEPLGHEYEDGICTRCKSEDPDYTPPFRDVDIMTALSEGWISDTGTYKAWLDPNESISAFGESHTNCFSINTAASYNLWNGGIQSVNFRVDKIEFEKISFSICGEAGTAGEVSVEIFVDRPADDSAPDYEYVLKDAAYPVRTDEIPVSHSLSIRVENHAGNQNRIVFYDFMGIE